MPTERVSGTESDAIIGMKMALSKFETINGRMNGLSYKPRPNDIAITTTPKAGTTWLQQIVYQLKTNGDMDFEEISSVVPWIELAYDLDQDLEAKQVGEDEGMPRCFKTHCWADHCPEFPKTIVVIRNPYDVALSFYHFFEGWFFQPGSITLDTFVTEFWLARGIPESKTENASYFHHLISWYKRRDESGVLTVCFEDIKDDLRGQIQRVARFMSNDKHNFDRPDLIDAVVKYSSFDYMKEHQDKFGETLTKRKRNTVCGLNPDAGMSSGKVRDGSAGKGKLQLSDKTKQLIDEQWASVVEPVTGCKTYKDLRTQLQELQ